MNTVHEMSPKQAINFICRLPMNVTPMIWGPPGVGKTDVVKEVAVRTNADLITVLASQSEPVDISGLPDISECHTHFFHRPPWWAHKATTTERNLIIFFDDVVNGEEQTLAALYKTVYERMAGDKPFKPNVRIVMAGNREEDKCNTKPMPTALSNRDMDIHIRSDSEGWLEWSLNNDVDPMCRAFISYFPQKLDTFKAALDAEETKAFATPRSWVLFSDCLKELQKSDIEESEQEMQLRWAAQGTIGTDMSSEFMGFLDCRNTFVPPEEIAAITSNDDYCRIPDSPDAMYATTASYESYCKKAMDDPKVTTQKRYQNIRAGCIYAAKIDPPDMGARFAQTVFQLVADDKLKLGDYYTVFMTDSIVNEWLEKWSKYHS
jgi:hypothetical protein